MAATKDVRAGTPLVNRELVAAAHRGDRGARDQLVSTHLPVVRLVATRYRDYGVPLEDLVQEGSIGLLEAVEHYDPDRGPEFEPYARFRIRRAIRNALTDQSRLIRHPKQIVERRRALDRAEAHLIAAGKSHTPRDLAAATALSVRAVLEAQAASQTPISLDEPVLPDGSELATLVADPAANDPALETIAHEEAELLARALAQLSERQRRVVSARWRLDGQHPVNGAQLASELALSPRRMQAIGQDALYELRKALEPGEVTA
jgi:RNA polymerase sigma factor (sigma-70 family)